MTTRKTFKRRVRARSARTGESYTAARAQLLGRADRSTAADETGSDELALDATALVGMSDEALRRGSGRSLGEWVGLLDAWGARERTHPEIARWLDTEHGIGGWWAQSVTVGYERARGMRAVHQQPSGFAVSATRTLHADADRINLAFVDRELRAAWLPDAPMRERRSTRGGSVRFDWGEPPSRVAVFVTPKDGGKAQVAVQHEQLPDADAAAQMKAMWRDRLSALKAMLEAG